MDRPEIVTQNITKVLAAFVIGLVTMFGGALIYSNMQQSSEPVQAVQRARLERPVPPLLSVPSAEPSAPAVISAQGLPENSIRVEGQKLTPLSTTAVLPESSTRNTTVLARPAENRMPTQSRALDQNGAESSQPAQQRLPVQRQVGRNRLSQFKPNSDVAPQPPSTFVQESQHTPDTEHHRTSVEQPQRAAEPPQIHPEPVPSAPQSEVVVVPATTTLEVRFSETLSSDHNRPGDTFRATLASPLVVSGYLLAEAGDPVLGRVETSRRAPLIGGRSELSVTLTEMGTWNGQRTRVETGWRKVKGTRNTLTNTAKIVTGAMVGSVNGAAKGVGITSSAREGGHESSGLMAESRTAVFPAGAKLTFILVAPFTTTGTRPR